MEKIKERIKDELTLDWINELEEKIDKLKKTNKQLTIKYLKYVDLHAQALLENKTLIEENKNLHKELGRRWLFTKLIKGE